MIELLHGDCLELMKDIPDKSIDMILCDLPYGTRLETWDKIVSHELLWSEYKRIIKDGKCVALFGSEPFSSYLRMSNIKQYKYDWVWDKDQGGNFAMAKKQPLKTHENIIIFNSDVYFPIMTKADKKKIRPIIDGYKVNDYIIQKHSHDYEIDKRYPKSIISYSANNKECNKLNRVHPTQKPVTLLEYLIKTYTLENETVLDNCMGSGSTGVACINTNRNFIGIEKDLEYFKIAEKRIKEAQENYQERLF